MKYKYGEYPQEQVHGYKAELHNKIHWLLLYKEQDYEHLDKYFAIIQSYLDGLNELFWYDPQVIHLMSIIEYARLESQKADCDFYKYRKAVFDAHSAIDKLPEMDGD